MLKYLKNEIVVGGKRYTKKGKKIGEKIGGINKNTLTKVYSALKQNYSKEINFKILNFETFVEYVLNNGYEEEDVNETNLHYELKDNYLYEL